MFYVTTNKVLELVANEWDELEKGKEEIQNWISDVKKELTKDEGEQEVDVVKMREKIKVREPFDRPWELWSKLLRILCIKLIV